MGEVKNQSSLKMCEEWHKCPEYLKLYALKAMSLTLQRMERFLLLISWIKLR